MKKEEALWIFGEEVGESSLMDWIRAHTSFLKPLHRYEGFIEVRDEEISLEGNSTKDEGEFSLKIPRNKILYINHGYDDVFRRSLERSLGAGLAPLLIEYKVDDSSRKLYFFINFSRVPRTSDNDDWFHNLVDWVDKE